MGIGVAIHDSPATGSRGITAGGSAHALSWRKRADAQIQSPGDPLTLSRPAARELPKVVLADLLRSKLIDAGVKADRLPQRTLHTIARAIRDTTGGLRTFDLNNNVRVNVTKNEVTISTAD